MIALDELSAIAQINNLHFLKQRIFTKTLTELQLRVDCASTEMWMRWYKNVDTENLNVYLSNELQGRLSN